MDWDDELAAAQPWLGPAQLAILGARDGADLERHGVAGLAGRVELVDAAALAADPAGRTRRAADRIAAASPAGFWLHLDWDVMSTAAMPAITMPHPGGLDWDALGGVVRAALVALRRGRLGRRGLQSRPRSRRTRRRADRRLRRRRHRLSRLKEPPCPTSRPSPSFRSRVRGGRRTTASGSPTSSASAATAASSSSSRPSPACSRSAASRRRSSAPARRPSARSRSARAGPNGFGKTLPSSASRRSNSSPRSSTRSGRSSSATRSTPTSG